MATPGIDQAFVFIFAAMRLLLRKPNQAIKKVYARQPVLKTQLEAFGQALAHLQSRIDVEESAEFQKTIVSRFLEESLFRDSQIKAIADLPFLEILHDDGQDVSAVVVIKRAYGAEMMMPLKPNVRALHELILYYFDACFQNPGRSIRQLVVTDAYNWFVFDEQQFRGTFFENARLRRIYQLKLQHRKDDQYFYSESAKIIRDLKGEIPVTYYNIRDVSYDSGAENDAGLLSIISFYKLLSPEHLLGLDKYPARSFVENFYEQLLPILGLQEIQQKTGERIIQRLPSELRQPDSLVEIAIRKIEEGQVITTIRGAARTYIEASPEPTVTLAIYGCYTFLTKALWKKVLLAYPPLTNSAEHFFDTVLLGGHILTEKEEEQLHAFLDTYSFISEGSRVLLPEEKPFLTIPTLKQVIGKLIDSRDADTEEMTNLRAAAVKEGLRRAVIQRFNKHYTWACTTLDELLTHLEKISSVEANQLIDGLAIGDLAAGSGYWMEVALYELLVIKSDLGILQDEEGFPLRHYSLTVEDGELFVVDAEGNLFDYLPSEKGAARPTEGLRVQKSIFAEKQKLLKCSLWGVEANPAAVIGCQLRLSLSLLSSSYTGADLTGKGLNLAVGNALVAPETTDEKALLERLQRLSADYVLKYQTNQLFQVELTSQQQKDKARKERDIIRLEARIREQNNELVYGQAVDWHTIFAGLTDSKGNFNGFDMLICQPPDYLPAYWTTFIPYLKQTYPAVFATKAEPYVYFVALGMRMLQTMGLAIWLLPSAWQTGRKTVRFRKWLDSEQQQHDIKATEGVLCIKLGSPKVN